MRMFRRGGALVLGLLAACARAQVPGGEAAPSRIDLGQRFSIEAPAGAGWQPGGTPGSFRKTLEGRGHTLVLQAAAGASGISREEIASIREAGGANRMVQLVQRFVENAWKAHAAGLDDARYSKLQVVNDTGGKYSFGRLLCAYSRIRALDRGAPVGDAPTELRLVAYSCLEFSDMTSAASASYSERGLPQELSDEVLAEGERFVRSLRRED